VKLVSSELTVTETESLQKSVAADLKMNDPTGIIAKGKEKVNENPQKYDGRASGFYNIEDLFSPCK
jgi:hypothetical protein